jgi:hypothetical protein
MQVSPRRYELRTRANDGFGSKPTVLIAASFWSSPWPTRRQTPWLVDAGQTLTHALEQQACSTSAKARVAYISSGLRCVVSKNVVASFSGHVASEAGFMQCLVARSSVLEVTKPPAARRSVLF